ncbi:FAD-dependent oxidoreductase [Streptomyces sp. GbtcB7]|uniref:FAD-dependent oxidoreductase n=1 Tax=Streptomyces sp. GbtcB7 TaxID=2824752 RepID=UPI001C3057E8|nr:FAD-dependent oxidoreductase [Streptomyces sp. GbtcB7]
MVGARLIGLEVAATARALGCGITVVEAVPEALGRVLPPMIAQAITRLHQHHGVDILAGLQLNRFEQVGGMVAAMDQNSTSIVADTVVTAVGMTPATSLAERVRCPRPSPCHGSC